MATTLQQLINRMNVYMPIRNLDEVYKVNAIDQAVRMFRTKINPPWVLKKSSLRVFQNVLVYPTASDHAQLAILDDPIGQDLEFGQHPRYQYTSLRDFLEDPTARNSIAEIWETGVRMLGVRNKISSGLTEQLLGAVTTASQWAGSGDAGTPALDNVLYLTGTSSIRVPITSSSGTATVTDTFTTSITETNYKAKYFFVAVYLAAVPTSIEMRLRTDGSNYLSTTVTAQFAGQPFVAGNWNIIAMDLNTATTTGTVTGTFASAQYILTGAATGNYNFDASFLRGWILQDYRYYSTNNVLDGSTYQDYFAADSATYNLSAQLLGDTAWHDPVMYEACLSLLSDLKESAIFQQISALRTRTWDKFFDFYPDSTPQMTTDVWRFGTDYSGEMGWPDLFLR